MLESGEREREYDDGVREEGEREEWDMMRIQERMGWAGQVELAG
jgi:hypothetical protein